VVSGAGVSPVPGTPAVLRASLSAPSNPAAINAAPRRARQREMNPAETGALSRAPVRSAARSIPITPVLAGSVAAATTFGPWHTGPPVTPGGGGAVVTCPHPQVRHIIWYSVTVSAAAGISSTCTRDATRPGAPARSAPHPPHAPGSTARVSSGRGAQARLAPGCLSARPAAGPAAPAGRLPWPLAFASAAGPSWLGGCDEFGESRPARLPAQRRDLGAQRPDQRGRLRHHRQQLRHPRRQLSDLGSLPLMRRLLRIRHFRTKPWAVSSGQSDGDTRLDMGPSRRTAIVPGSGQIRDRPDARQATALHPMSSRVSL